MVTVKCTSRMEGFRASVLAEKYKVTIEEGRKLKTGEAVELADTKAEALVKAGLALVESKPSKKPKPEGIE